MPSERRRQRQQKVRHEVGDYVPSSPKEDSQECQEIETQPSSNHHQSSPSSNKKTIEEALNKKSLESNESYQRANDTNINSRTFAGTGNENGCRQDRGRGPELRGRARGRGATTTQSRPKENVYKPKPASLNVAFAEEREYEPVMIMETKKETRDESATAALAAEPAKYRRSEVISSWLRYDELPHDDDPEEGEDYMLGEDFSEILKLNWNKGAGGFLHLKGEMSWGAVDNSTVGAHGLGALKVADLVAALATIPLHEQLKIPEEALPVFTVSTYKDSAQRSMKSYSPDDQNYVTDMEVNQKIESLMLSEKEPKIRLAAAEEPESLGKKPSSITDAMNKFSEAFRPEPDDVDLESFVPEGTPEPQQDKRPVRKFVPAVTIDAVKPEKAEFEPVANKNVAQEDKYRKVGAEVKIAKDGISPQKKDVSEQKRNDKERLTGPEKVGFNFGLSKANIASDGAHNKTGAARTKDASTTEIKKSKNENKERTKEKEPEPIDLDKPRIKTKTEKAPVLVDKSEVENLEDWLDSVLDD